MANKVLSEKSHSPVTPADTFTQLQAAGFENMLGAGNAWLKTMGEMGTEVMSFVTERIKEDVKTQHRMLNCKDVSELQQVQAEFLEKAVEQYRAETGKLLEMSTKAYAKLNS